MKTALDYYVRGKQKESNADDYNSNSSYVKGRFICPECGEPVHIRPSKYANFFVHYSRTNENDECDRRVDGNSSESIYERMGLPLYIKKDNQNHFFLYMLFRAIPEELLKKAEKNKAFIAVDGKKYFINSERFSTENSVLLPIDYIPLSNQNYHLKVAPNSISPAIEKYWSTYADSFTYDGGLFTVTESGGRRIRHGDNIATDTEYYWVRRQIDLPSFYSGICMNRIGELILKDRTWSVYKGYFSSSISDSEYRLLTDYLRENLRVHLIEKVSEVIPLWPPMIKDEDGYKYKPIDKRVFGRIISGNDNPKTYLYRNISSDPEEISVNDGVVEFYTRNSEIVINVDRKYISGGTTFSIEKRKAQTIIEEPKVEFDDNILYVNGLDSKEVIVIRKDGQILRCKNETELVLKDLNNGDVVLLVGHYHLFNLYFVELEKDEDNRINETELKKAFSKFSNAKAVKLPHELRKRLNLLIIEDKELKSIIEEVLQSGEISYPLLRTLWGNEDVRE